MKNSITTVFALVIGLFIMTITSAAVISEKTIESFGSIIENSSSENNNIALVQGPTKGSANIAEGTFTANLSNKPTCGNILILGYSGIGVGAPSISTISQLNVVWSRAVTNGAQSIWYGIVLPNAGTTITITVTGGYGSLAFLNTAIVCEWRGLSITNCVDRTAINSDGYVVASDTGTTSITSQADELWIGITNCFVNSGSATQSSPTNGFTILDGISVTQPTYADSTAYLYKIVNTTGQANSGTSFAGGWYTGAIATFRAATPTNGIGSASNVYCGQLSNGTYFLDNGLYTLSSSSSTIINKAITDVNANGGGYVTLINGTIILDGTLVPKSNVYFKATGITISQPALSSLSESISLMLTTTPIENFTVDGGTWNGNKGALADFRLTSTWDSNFFSYFGISVYCESNNNITIKNAVVMNVIGQGIDLYDAHNSLITNCTVINAGDNPITLDTSSENSIIEKCTVVGGQDVGINTWAASNCTIRECQVSNVTQYNGASHWGIAAEVSQNVNILNNTVSNCEYNIVSTSTDSIIYGNKVDGKGYSNFGIQIQTSANNLVSYNTITGCNNAFGTYVPTTQTANVTLQGNTGLTGYYSLSITLAGTGTVSETSTWCNQGITPISGNNWQFPAGSTVKLTAIPAAVHHSTDILLPTARLQQAIP
jgi:parallel beta-helix repeat protein